MKFEAELGGETIPIEVTGSDGRYRVAVSPVTFLGFLKNYSRHMVDVSDQDGVSIVEVDGERYHVRVEEETRYIIRTRGGKAATGGQVLKAPMPGKVVHIEVEVGQAVHPGDGLIVLEAMKMENEFRAAVAGRVREISVQVGQTVNPGDTLVVIE